MLASKTNPQISSQLPTQQLVAQWN